MRANLDRLARKYSITGTINKHHGRKQLSHQRGQVEIKKVGGVGGVGVGVREVEGVREVGVGGWGLGWGRGEGWGRRDWG